jgi:hypothetical protein
MGGTFTLYFFIGCLFVRLLIWSSLSSSMQAKCEHTADEYVECEMMVKTATCHSISYFLYQGCCKES